MYRISETNGNLITSRDSPGHRQGEKGTSGHEGCRRPDKSQRQGTGHTRPCQANARPRRYWVLQETPTGKDAFTKLNPGIPKSELGQYTVEIGKIAVTLSSGRFPKLLDKLDPAEGSTAVRFVVKGVN